MNWFESYVSIFSNETTYRAAQEARKTWNLFHICHLEYFSDIWSAVQVDESAYFSKKKIYNVNSGVGTVRYGC